MKPVLNLAAYKTDVTNLGPGKRFVIWVQGCPFNCKNCLSQDWIPFKKSHIVAVEDLADLIVKTPDIAGVTLSGGEPMMQAYGLSYLLKILKKRRPELNSICYTGFKLKQLVWIEAQDLLSYLDVVITGLYVDKLNDNQGLRGSSNQKIIFLTEKLKKYEALFNTCTREVEITLFDNEIFATGMPNKRINLQEI